MPAPPWPSSVSGSETASPTTPSSSAGNCSAAALLEQHEPSRGTTRPWKYSQGNNYTHNSFLCRCSTFSHVVHFPCHVLDKKMSHPLIFTILNKWHKQLFCKCKKNALASLISSIVWKGTDCSPVHWQNIICKFCKRGYLCKNVAYYAFSVCSDIVMYGSVPHAESDHLHKPFNCTDTKLGMLRYIHYQLFYIHFSKNIHIWKF